MSLAPVLINGSWQEAQAIGSFHAENPTTKSALDAGYPISAWADCEAALEASAEAFQAMRSLSGNDIAGFLEECASQIEAGAGELVEMAHLETALPKSPRLADVELPRTTGQLRQAAAAARSESWRQAVIDSANQIRSCYSAIGPVAVFGPNNFPFAFGSASGGDFAAAIAAGNPVIAKANSSHPGTTRLFAECARAAMEKTGMPPGLVQLIYRTSHEVGAQLVSDPRIGATGYTGSRHAGLVLKEAADQAGKPIYLELSSVNPVVFLPALMHGQAEAMATEFAGSCLAGTGQFCTNPGMVLLIAGGSAERFVAETVTRFASAPVGTLLSKSVQTSLLHSHDILRQAGAEVLCGTGAGGGTGYSVANTLFRISGARFLNDPVTMQTEAFGNTSLLVVAADLAEAAAVLSSLEGNLTGSLYSAADDADDAAYDQLEPILRSKVGRLLNNKMPTGVAVSPAMNHGGPFPATGHPGFTAVGIPAALTRFAVLQCYDNVREDRLPEVLRDAYDGPAQRLVDGRWT
jgi:NADP-dependent aldehyde dehydrogenase